MYNISLIFHHKLFLITVGIHYFTIYSLINLTECLFRQVTSSLISFLVVRSSGSSRPKAVWQSRAAHLHYNCQCCCSCCLLECVKFDLVCVRLVAGWLLTGTSSKWKVHRTPHICLFFYFFNKLLSKLVLSSPGDSSR